MNQQPQAELREEISSLFATAMLGGSPFNSDDENKKVRDDAYDLVWKKIEADKAAALRSFAEKVKEYLYRCEEDGTIFKYSEIDRLLAETLGKDGE